MMADTKDQDDELKTHKSRVSGIQKRIFALGYLLTSRCGKLTRACGLIIQAIEYIQITSLCFTSRVFQLATLL
ncbi:MAG: hypothetical protein P4M11_04075 [Candidatus Pacebacteria bacterium]|nr:hypothetical protein [Candidatus Paceibacterota bacterium]